MSNQEKGNIRTLALQVSEELFQRIDQCVAKYPKLNKKAFLTKIITEWLTHFATQNSYAAAYLGGEGVRTHGSRSRRKRTSRGTTS